MKMPSIQLKDLRPAEAPFTISGLPGVTLHLKPFSLAAKTWAVTKYGSLEAVNKRFASNQVEHLSELFWYLLKEKDLFGESMTTFLEAVLTVEDQVNLLNAVTLSLGVSQADANELYKTAQEFQKKAMAQPKAQPKRRRK